MTIGFGEITSDSGHHPQELSNLRAPHRPAVWVLSTYNTMLLRGGAGFPLTGGAYTSDLFCDQAGAGYPPPSTLPASGQDITAFGAPW
jgi:hypothetical protein